VSLYRLQRLLISDFRPEDKLQKGPAVIGNEGDIISLHLSNQHVSVVVIAASDSHSTFVV